MTQKRGLRNSWFWTLNQDYYEKSKSTALPDLAVAWSFRVLNIYGKGTSQRKMQDQYSVKVKQLAAYITRRKYLGGMDRKRRLSGQDEGASTSKRPALK